MKPWVESAVKWFEHLSAGGFWLLALLMVIDFMRQRKELAQSLAELEIEFGPILDGISQYHGDTPDEWGWIVDFGGTGQPLWVPLDEMDTAMHILNQETEADKEEMQGQQWQWVVNAMAIRQAMAIAQQEPNLEMAFLTWMAQTPVPEEAPEDE
jgi:hypothetical protein